MSRPRSTIVCVDCGGRCHLLGHPPEDNAWEVGDIVAYRCEDCLDRWDLELTEDDLDDLDDPEVLDRPGDFGG